MLINYTEISHATGAGLVSTKGQSAITAVKWSVRVISMALIRCPLRIVSLIAPFHMRVLGATLAEAGARNVPPQISHLALLRYPGDARQCFSAR